jgi:type II secretory pathway component PulJ
MSRLREQRGTSLVELLTAIVMGLVVLGAGVTAFASYLSQSATVDRRNDAQDSARSAIDQLVIQLRSATSSGLGGNKPVESVSASDLVFLAPNPAASLSANPLGLQHVRYCLTSSTTNQVLWRQTAPYNTGANPNPPAHASCPSSLWSVQTPVADHLVNTQTATSLFGWTLDSSSNVTDVAVTASVDVDPSKAPPATALRSSVTLRNLNHTPVAVVTCRASSNGHALCDAAASSDSDGQTLQYSWTVDGGAVAETSSQLDTPSLVAASTHTFQVTVTDSGGLTAAASQQVTMS